MSIVLGDVGGAEGEHGRPGRPTSPGPARRRRAVPLAPRGVADAERE
ncbi:hypothetical protein [Streptoalloteichus tenebrarius]|nr:hypothetical protein [Streptoalloteichus tenebrarius]